jgi:hypothetical protein
VTNNSAPSYIHAGHLGGYLGQAGGGGAGGLWYRHSVEGQVSPGEVVDMQQRMRRIASQATEGEL